MRLCQFAHVSIYMCVHTHPHTNILTVTLPHTRCPWGEITHARGSRVRYSRPCLVCDFGERLLALIKMWAFGSVLTLLLSVWFFPPFFSRRCRHWSADHHQWHGDPIFAADPWDAGGVLPVPGVRLQHPCGGGPRAHRGAGCVPPL